MPVTIPLMMPPAPPPPSSHIDLSSGHTYELPLCYFVADLQQLLATQAPFAEEFYPYIAGGIEIIALFARTLDPDFKERVDNLRTDFADFQQNPALLDRVLQDCQAIKAFPHLRFAHRILAFETAASLLASKAGAALEEVAYSDRLYLYGAVRALSEVHGILCAYVSSLYAIPDWGDHALFEEVEQLAHDFLLNPTLYTQYQLQIGLALLAEKIENL